MSESNAKERTSATDNASESRNSNGLGDLERPSQGEALLGDMTPSSKPLESQYPLTWLPAMVVSSENHSSYAIDPSSDKMPDLISPGMLVNLPSGYGGNSNNKLYGLVVGPNAVFPIENMSVVNMPSFSKITNSQNSIGGGDSLHLGDEAAGLLKMDAGNNSHQDISFPSISGDSVEKDQLVCVYCHKFLKSMNELQNHLLLEHTEQSSLGYLNDTAGLHASLQTCPGCGHQLRKIGTYDPEFHSITSSHDEDPNISITNSSNILMVCDHCCKEFTLALAPDPSQVPPTEPPKRHFCDHCDKSYKHNRDLRKHMRTHHGIDNSSQSVTTSYPSTTSQNASFHQEPHAPNPKMMCQQCKKMFRGPFELRRHIHTVHENKRPYKCPECCKLFRDAYELKRHSASHQRVHYHAAANSSIVNDGSNSIEMLRLQNSGQANPSSTSSNAGHLPSSRGLQDVYSMQSAPTTSHASSSGTDYYCTTCEKYFRGANEFKRHYSVVHEKKYRYKCIHCGKLWRDQYDLKRHCRRSHFVDRDIDRAFIRQCLLENTPETGSNLPQSIPMSSYELPSQVTLTLDHESAAAIFGTGDNDIRNSNSQLDPFGIVDHNSLNIGRVSPTGSMFQNIPSIQPASMLYHSTTDASHLVDHLIPSHDCEAINEESKNAATWSNFESDIQVLFPH